jgi:uncharacterized membrane protein YeaQ/YmgE (transglycosylase-associated protein family)
LARAAPPLKIGAPVLAARSPCTAPLLNDRRRIARAYFPRREYAWDMHILDVVILLVVAGVCGSIGQALAGYSHSGCLGSIAVGFIGALLGLWLSRQLRLPELFVLRVNHHNFPVVWSIIGATLFVAVVALIARRRDGG